MLFCVVIAEVYGFHVGRDQVLLLGERLLEQPFYHFQVDVGERGDDPDVGDVLHQDPGPDAIKPLVAHARKRHADDGNVIAV